MIKKMKIAYCIPSLYYPSGMERVLTLKANYFAEHFGYDIHIILTDGKDRKPYYELHPSIRIRQLDISFINKMNDGSIKLGEIHFNKSNYRSFSDNQPPAYLQQMGRKRWMRQLIRQLKKLERFKIEQIAAEWKELFESLTTT